MYRRKYLATSATVTTAILAGCSLPGGEEDGEDGGEEEGDGDEEEGGEERLNSRN